MTLLFSLRCNSVSARWLIGKAFAFLIEGLEMAATTLAPFSLNSDVIFWSRGSRVSAFPYKYSL